MAGPHAKGVPRRSWYWAATLVLLVSLRLPSLVQPAGGDQGLYAYSGQRILAGDVMYRDVWDQKPPAIAFLYAGLSKIWPHESLVPGADLAAAVLVAGFLILLGRRRFTPDVGYGAAATFLLFGDPYLQRLSGIYVRGQCEPFIAVAVTACVVLMAVAEGRARFLIAAGVALGVAFWLKYNALAYALPGVAAAWVWSPDRGGGPRSRSLVGNLGWTALGFGLPGALALIYFAANGALHDWRLATIDYNLQYSNETYEGSVSMLRYVLAFPIERARIDMLWFLGGLGSLLLARKATSRCSALVTVCWLLAAIVSIAVNGSRSLPNYFVQANPALALAAASGLATLWSSGALVRIAAGVLLLAATWRVGSDTPVWGWRLASLPGLVENVAYDLRHLRGDIGRDDYVSRFKGQKHDVLEIDRLVRYVRTTTRAGEPVLVFGFSGGSVGWKSERRSPSRFFWSRPVIIEFAADQPGYGSAGLLEDLQRTPPSIVALQKEEWRSYDAFMGNARLRAWLEGGYRVDRETSMFSIWRRADRGPEEPQPRR